MSATLDKPCILVIDDSDVITDLVAAFLSDAGFTVVTANSGAAGLELANTIRPAAVLCDFGMPGLSGFEVLDRLRSNDYTRDVPFIMMTGGLDNLPISHPHSPHDILLKPFTPTVIVAAVSKAVRSARMLPRPL